MIPLAFVATAYVLVGSTVEAATSLLFGQGSAAVLVKLTPGVNAVGHTFTPFVGVNVEPRRYS